MEASDSSEDEGVINDNCVTDGSNDTMGVRTHFWLEHTYIDERGAEQWQTEQVVSQKLWHLTKIVNLVEIEREFPAVSWTEVLQRIWIP